MIDLAIEESSGYPLLGFCLATLTEVLNNVTETQSYAVVMEYPVVKTTAAGKNPSCDATVITFSDMRCSRLPLLLCEYKPRINFAAARVDPGHFIELLVQGYYCLKAKQLASCLLCLTDLQTRHYYKLCKSAGDEVTIEWVKSFRHATWKPTRVDLQEHYCFIASAILNIRN